MAVSKRTRYEVLRRDGHKCRYCGLAAAETELTVDHVVPTTLGGSDDPSNLVAACKDCNAGKSSSIPDGPLVAQVAEDAVRWAAALRGAAGRMLARHDERAAFVAEFLDEWHNWDDAGSWLPSDWLSTVARWCDAGLPAPVLVEAVKIAMGKRIAATKVFVYLCGIVRNRLAELTEEARQDFVSQIAAASPGRGPCESCDMDECPWDTEENCRNGLMVYTAGKNLFRFADVGYRQLAGHVDGRTSDAAVA